MSYLLGKLPKKHDHRNLKLAAYLPDKPILPSAVDWSTADKVPWPLYSNDKIGDCSCCAAAHMAQNWTANAEVETIIAESDVIAAYKAVSGYNGDPSTDTGAAVLDVLKLWRTTGIGIHFITAFTEVAPMNPVELQASIFWMGGLYLGFTLPRSIIGKMSGTVVPTWDVEKDDGGVWGGHAVCAVGYNQDGSLKIVSWDKTYTVTKSFVDNYCDEAYACLSQDWLAATGLSPSGLNIDQLQADLLKVGTL